MESELLHLIIAFVAGLVGGALLMLLWNKLSSGSASPAGLKQEYDDYQNKVEAHFEETSKKFQDMTEQYQDLYKHLSVGATSLCRPDSVAAGLADESSATVKLEKPESVVDVDAEAANEESENPASDQQEAQVDDKLTSDKEEVVEKGSDSDAESTVTGKKDEESAS